MDLLKVFSNKTTTPKDVAKDRLKLILIHDRGDIDPETIDKIRMEILQVLSKYIVIMIKNIANLCLFFNFVSNSPHHLQIFWFSGIDLNLLPDISYMHHDRICVDGPLMPYPFIDLFR